MKPNGFTEMFWDGCGYWKKRIQLNGFNVELDKMLLGERFDFYP